MQQLAQAWLGLLVDTSIKSMLLASVTGLAIFMLRMRDTNLRHRVWTAVLLGMLSMPALVYVTPAVPLPGWLTLTIPTASAEPNPIGDEPEDTLVANLPPNTLGAAGDESDVGGSRSDAFANQVMNELPPDARGAMQPLAGFDSSKANPIANNIQNARQPTVVTQIASRWPIVLASLYFAVAFVFGVRLLVGLMLTHRLIVQAREISLVALLPLPRRRRFRLLESTLVHVPATVGFLRPVVLLPRGWRQWSESKLQAVLAHELAHVRRADWLVITLAELNRAVYWFHPISWILRRWLSDLAEQNCDDAVIEAAGDRTQYARYLLEVASSLTSAGSRYRPPLHGIAMARRPNVETRIDAILDAGRPLARRLGALGMIGLLVIGIPAILLAAALRTAADDTQQKRVADTNIEAVAKAEDKITKDTAEAAPDGMHQHVQGRVLGPDGEPVAGATVYAAWGLMRRDPPSERIEHTILARTQSDDQGNYELMFATAHPDMKRLATGWHIAAFAPGLGPAWQRDVHVVKDASAKSTTTLTLTSDEPIRGRVVDLEGNPLAGVQVRIHALRPPESERAILGWIQEAKDKTPPHKLDDYFAGNFSNSPYPGAFPIRQDDGGLAHGSPALPADAETDKDGRFQFNQLGANRLVILELEGPNIAKCYVHVVTREMEAVSARPVEIFGVRAGTYYGREFQFVAEPTQPIVGRVTDAETDQPLANLEVHVQQFAGNLFGQRDFLATRTDEQGHFKLIGAPRGGGHRITVNPSSDQPYFPTEKKLAKVSGFDPITCDFSLRLGQWIVGKVTDRESGAPIKDATVEYLPLRDNEHAQDYPNYKPEITGHTPSDRYRTTEDGTFRVLAIPGAGILAAIAKDLFRNDYSSLTLDLVPKHLVRAGGSLNTYHPWFVTGYHALREVELSKSNEEVTYDLEFTRGLSRIVKLVDAQGQAVKSIRVLGRYFPPMLEKPAMDSAVEIIGLRPNDERDVIFIHPERRIGKAVTISAGDETTVELEPCAVARGRAVDDEGHPVRDLEVNVTIDNRSDNWRRALIGAATSQDGRFEVLLPPGTNYRIWHYSKNAADFSVECQSKPGAVFELGDLTNGTKLSADQTEKLISSEQVGAHGKVEIPPAEQAPMPTISDAKRGKIHGHIVGAAGKPLPGVDVAVVAWRVAPGRGGDLTPHGTVLAETTTDADGHYQLMLAGVSSKTNRDANVIARASASAVVWRRLNLDADEIDISFELQPEQAVSGRLVDIEGQPAAGVRLRVNSMMAKVSGDQLSAEGIGVFDSPHLPAAWPQPILTDGEGRFTIRGIPKDHGVYLQVDGSDRFAPQSLVLNTGILEQRSERDGTYRPQVVKNLKPGEEAVLPLAPAQLFTGTVRFEDTHEPAANARLTIWASQQKYGSMISVAGRANEKGRFKISPNPGIQFGVTAYPPDGAAYLVRELKPISWQGGARSKEVNVTLPRGVLVRGQVLEQGSNSPIVGASIQYVPEGANNPHQADGILTGWQDIQVSDDQGRFQIVVLPGPGRLFVHGPQNDFVFQETSERELYNGRPGGQRNYAHGIERIDAAPNAEPLEVTVRLRRGATVRGELVDGQGASIEEAVLVSRFYLSAFSLNWRGRTLEVMGGRFEISGLAPDQEYPVHFLGSKRRLGATLMVKAGMDSPRVVLEPCGDAKMRFVDDAGKPVAKYEPTVQFVMTPGGLEFNRSAMNTGTLAADADLIVNIDRANHSYPEQSDDEGRLTVPALIPGATYRIVTYRNKEFVLSKEFKASTGETVDLGDIAVERRE